jgi:hypothetical protein
VDWDVVGDAVHGFLAADVPELEAEERLGRARRILLASNLVGLLGPESLVRAGTQLRTWVEARWPAAWWHREYPVTCRVETAHGARRVQGTIDLLIETADGVVIVDHKSFPGGAAQRIDKAREYAPQLAAYCHALAAAGQRVVGMYVHFPIAAAVVELRF